MFEMDMERQYVDLSWGLDEVNSELQIEAQALIEAEIEAAYDEWLDSVLAAYYHHDDNQYYEVD